MQQKNWLIYQFGHVYSIISLENCNSATLHIPVAIETGFHLNKCNQMG